MKIILFLSLALVVYTHAFGDEEISQKWREFQVKFGKSYRSPVEARKRLNIFKQNLEEIDSHNSIYDQGLVSYKKGINQFADWTKDEFKQYVNKGLISRPTLVGKYYVPANDSVLPESVDWREKGAVTAVKDQGGCGSCWAFSATGSLEGQLALVKKELIALSEQNLMDCSWNEGNRGCNGGWMNQGFDYIKDNGIESEADYPYKEEDSKCKADSSKTVTKITSYKQIPEDDEGSLLSAIATVGPVSVAIDATLNLQLYSSGILVDDWCSEDSLNHGVLAIGYGTENGQDYYIIKNSWGESWGESGYVRLAKSRQNICGIASVASYPVL